MNERRKNGTIREQAQRWFDALRTHLAGEGGQGDVAERLRAWATIEDLMGDCPQLIPALMAMAWQLRGLPAFAPLFQSASGSLVDDPKSPIAPCGKGFDDVVLAQLQGAVRVFCARQERAWLALEKERHKPTGLAAHPLVARFLRVVRRQRDEDLLEHYPQHGLYLALKPYLRHRNQFALVEALASLPTRTVAILGPATRGLIFDSSIRNLAALETAKCKFVTMLARAFADTVIADAGAPTPPVPMAKANIEPRPTSDNLHDLVGASLSHLAVDGLHLAKAALAVRDVARDIVVKLSVPLGHGLWKVFADQEAALNVARCPAAAVAVVGADAVRVHRKTADALNALTDTRLVEVVMGALATAASREDLVAWMASPACATAWERMSGEINGHAKTAGPAGLAPEGVADFARSMAPSFAALAANDAPAPVA